MIVDQIRKLCERENITFAQLEKELKFGNGTIRRWDDSFPSIAKVAEVAKFFGVSVDCLINNQDHKN